MREERKGGGGKKEDERDERRTERREQWNTGGHLFQVIVSHAEEVRELDTVTLEEREKVSKL